MVNVANPNTKSKIRQSNRAAKLRKISQKRSQAAKYGANRVAKADTKRGARTGLLPTSGPRAPMSAKRRRKLERKLGYDMKRKMEAEGEVEMQDAEGGEVAKEGEMEVEGTIE
ncbi:hypothetical protein jhhlp_002832 [Lomentospora prolificans]|uniref:Ribosome biogenesis protein ALB1 n=1 Tax=Lomentospora prolificans TaxID=41688 RepID=A0A2N3NF92_9PEZI|nr:hypothetical protein jhhlp_002832 [Lomentospora prolificans]